MKVYNAASHRFTIEARPLSELGLQGASIVYPDGTEHQLTTITVETFQHPKKPLAEHVRSALEKQYPGCKLVIPL